MEAFNLVDFGLDDFDPVFGSLFRIFGGILADGFLAEEEKVQEIIFGLKTVIFEYDLAN